MNAERRCTSGWVLGLAVLLAGGCKPSAEGPDTSVLPQSERTVEAYGLTLDSAADPQLVTWAMLRTLAEDLAAQPGTPEQLAAFARACELSHVTHLRSRIGRDEDVVEYIKRFAPTINYYSDAIPDDLETARAAMKTTPISGLENGYSALAVQFVIPGGSRSPDPAAAYAVSIAVGLVRQGNGPWRVIEVGFGPSPELQSSPPSAGP